MENTVIKQSQHTLEEVRALVADELLQIDARILELLSSKAAINTTIGQHILASGGKRIRPLVTLLSAKACNYEADYLNFDDKAYVEVAMIIEFLHTATLLHDDVVDHSTMRRGKATANVIWGNQLSVLAGDFLYSRAFQAMTELDNSYVMRLLAEATARIAEGEVLQLMNQRQFEATEAEYFQIIQYKTAELFRAAAGVGAIVAGNLAPYRDALLNYGEHLGLAFQLIDDLLDYDASTGKIGKNVGDDLAEGKPTLPVIYALQSCKAGDAKIIKKAITQGNVKNLEAVLEIIHHTGALEYTREKAQEQSALAIKALELMPSGKYLDGLEAVARIAVNREA